MVDDFLHTHHESADTLREQVRHYFAALSADQLNWRPSPAVWSIAQCLDHLTISDRLYFESLRQSILQAQTGGQEGYTEYKPRRLARWFIRKVGPDGGRMKNPTIFSPAPGQYTVDVLKDFDNHQRELMELIRRSDGIDLNRPRLSSPVTRWLRFSIGEVFQLILAHQQRHIHQARRLAEMPAFGIHQP